MVRCVGQRELPEWTPEAARCGLCCDATIDAVIDLVDDAVGSFLGAALGPEVDVTLLMPARDDVLPRGRSTVACVLVDITENTDRRVADWADVRDGSGRITGRRPPTQYYRLRYLVAAWDASVTVEHRLLGALLDACVATPVLPAGLLDDRLTAGGESVRLQVALPAGAGEPPLCDLWTALEQPMRASLTLLVEAAVRAPLDTDIAAPAEQLSMTVGQVGGVGSHRPDSAAGGLREQRAWTSFRIRETKA